MVSIGEWRWVTIWSLVLVTVAVLPGLFAYVAAPDDLFFSGFLVNPEDGHTYLAKMRQGWRGEWLAHLAFSSEPHDGEFLFTYYLLLGHVARWGRLPLIAVLYLARAVTSFFLLFVLYYTVAQFFGDIALRRLAFLLTALGSGLGWLTTFAGIMSVDLWVPEGYVFYSMFTNAHFPLSIALLALVLLWSVTPWGTGRIDWRRLVGIALCTAALGVLQPFCLLTVGVVLLVYAAVLWGRKRRLPWRGIVSGIVVGSVALPFAINAYLSTVQNPALAAWNVQNQTPSPPPWDYAIGYGIVLVLALVGMWRAFRRRCESDLFLLIWVLAVAALLYAPFSLQRRLVLGMIVPLGTLAALGWSAFPARWRPSATATWAVSSITHVFLLVMSVVMAIAGHEALFMTRDERDALQWLAEEVPQDALVAAAPETGLYIPAWSGQRVFYGHRFETPNADLYREQVEVFYAQGNLELLSRRPDYVFYGPEEQALDQGSWLPGAGWRSVYRQGTVTIYAVPQE